MYNNTNPAELYSGTTWELITSDKYIRTGSTPLSTGGSNSISITKANLPNIKLKMDTSTPVISDHKHIGGFARGRGYQYANGKYGTVEMGAAKVSQGEPYEYALYPYTSTEKVTSSSLSPYTESLGSGTALSIQPSYITLKFWKRLT